jgi:hypothetical protein
VREVEQINAKVGDSKKKRAVVDEATRKGKKYLLPLLLL